MIREKISQQQASQNLQDCDLDIFSVGHDLCSDSAFLLKVLQTRGNDPLHVLS